MRQTKFNQMMHDNNIILTMVANLSENSIMTIGNKSELEYDSLVENLFGDMEQIRVLNNSLKCQIMPQTWNQGSVKCLVCKPVDNIIIGLFFHEDKNVIESYRFDKELNQLINEIWEDEE